MKDPEPGQGMGAAKGCEGERGLCEKTSVVMNTADASGLLKGNQYPEMMVARTERTG